MTLGSTYAAQNPVICQPDYDVCGRRRCRNAEKTSQEIRVRVCGQRSLDGLISGWAEDPARELIVRQDDQVRAIRERTGLSIQAVGINRPERHRQPDSEGAFRRTPEHKVVDWIASCQFVCPGDWVRHSCFAVLDPQGESGKGSGRRLLVQVFLQRRVDAPDDLISSLLGAKIFEEAHADRLPARTEHTFARRLVVLCETHLDSPSSRPSAPTDPATNFALTSASHKRA